jgi:mono/diheme cytochrome c family protein
MPGASAGKTPDRRGSGGRAGVSVDAKRKRMTRRPIVALALAIAAVGLFTFGVARIFEDPRPRPGASRGEWLYYTSCATCHGVDGRGSWRARLSLIRPGDLTSAERMREHSDQYLFDLIKHGGSPVGRPGMPAFGYALKDEDIRALVEYLRQLSGTPPQRSRSSLTNLS